MTMARRGIFGMLAALPFVGKVAAAPSKTAEIVVTCDVVMPNFSNFEREVARNLASADYNEMQAAVVNDIFRESIEEGAAKTFGAFQGERRLTASSDIARDRFEIAIPWGWDTLENVR